jgi:hypothetical protein
MVSLPSLPVVGGYTLTTNTGGPIQITARCSYIQIQQQLIKSTIGVNEQLIVL